MKQYKHYIFTILLFLVFWDLAAQKKEPILPSTRILFVFDASQSMLGTWESDKKINIAKKYLISIIDSLEQLNNVQIALRVYGHQSPVPPQDCSDTKLEVPFTKDNASRIRQKLRYLIPKGTTPIAHSLELTENDFPKCANCRNIIILITDGIEACDGDPCEVSRYLQKKGIVLKPFVIGIGYDPHFKETFDCIGHFYNTPNEKKFKEILDVVISRALNSTTAQVNLLDTNNKPSETNVNLTFYDNYSGKIKYNFVHTINYMGNPDTLVLDPLITYDIVAHTLPPRRIDSITLIPGKHTMIGMKVPQGYLKTSCPGSYQYKDLPIIVREKNKTETLLIQQLGKTKKIITGKYDIEVLTLPRIKINDIEIQQSKTTTIEIPRPGIANFLMASSGYASLYSAKKDTLIHIYNFETNITRKSLVLQPGDYKIVYRAKKIQKTIFTISENFRVKSGASNSIILH
ncbi:MAG: VWA domain-containing protein [Bacteroidales bacterium]|nr:VWA domain-containing protein [Bacteroidales bacterium]